LRAEYFVPEGGGDRAVFLSAFISAVVFSSSVSGFFTRFLGGAGFFALGAVFFFVVPAVFFARAAFFFSANCSPASPVDGDLAARLTALFTGREGSPTAFLGFCGVA